MEALLKERHPELLQVADAWPELCGCPAVGLVLVRGIPGRVWCGRPAMYHGACWVPVGSHGLTVKSWLLNLQPSPAFEQFGHHRSHSFGHASGILVTALFDCLLQPPRRSVAPLARRCKSCFLFVLFKDVKYSYTS